MGAITVLLAGCAQTARAGYVDQVLADNPQGYWRFEEAAGTIALDSSLFARNGTYQLGVAYGAAGVPGA